MDIYRSKRNYNWGKITVLLGSIVLAVGLVILFFKLTYKTNLERAIEEYEDGDYISALRILNSLKHKLDFEKAEIAYYYSCKAINRLAEKLEKKFEDELEIIASPSVTKVQKDRESAYIENRLKKINDELGSDLKIVISTNKGRIISGGKFYDEFVARYKGSSYIEDLDYEELENLQKSEPYRLFEALFVFYEKYPRTNYLSQVVSIFFNNIDKSYVISSAKAEVLKKMLFDYMRRYPTSSHIHKIFMCKGENVNLRNSPGMEGKIVGKIVKDEMLIQIEKSHDVAQIGEMRDWWYRVLTTNGQQGWIFGKFLSPFDVSKATENKETEVWIFEEHFDEWVDSNTPKEWKHIEKADVGSIGFYESENKKIARLISKGNPCGLYRRMSVGKAFTVMGRGRHVDGKDAILFACATVSGEHVNIVLSKEGVDVLGNKISISTKQWHEYSLVSDDGKFAKLFIDGEIVLNKVPLKKSDAFRHAGLYCLLGISGFDSIIELEYVKFR